MEIDKVVVKVVADTSGLKAGMQGAVSAVNAGKNAIKPSLNEIDNAVKKASISFQQAQQQAAIFQRASQQLADQHKAGAISARQYRGSIAELSKEFGIATQKSNTFSSALKFSASVVGITSVTAAIAGMTAKMIESSREMQNLDARMKAITGGADQAGEAMAFLQGMSRRQSVDLLTLTDTYGRLLPAVKSGTLSMGDMRNMLSLVNDNMRAFGLSTSSQQALLYGLGQVLGSANVTMEDLRQVTDQMPGSFSAIEKAMGLASGELKDLIATGTVTAKDIVPAMTAAFEANAGAAEKMGNTYDATMIRMNQASRTFFSQLGEDTGIIALTTGLMKALTSAMDDYTDSVEGMNKKQLGEGLKESVEALQLQQGKVEQLNSKIKNAKAAGDTQEAAALMLQLDMENEQLEKKTAIYNRYIKALTPATKAAREQVAVTNDNIKADAGLAKSVDEIVKKRKTAADDFGKSAQQLELETIHKYKASDAYKVLAASTDKNRIAKVKEIQATEEQLRKYISLDSAKKSDTKATSEAKKTANEYTSSLKSLIDQKTVSIETFGKTQNQIKLEELAILKLNPLYEKQSEAIKKGVQQREEALKRDIALAKQKAIQDDIADGIKKIREKEAEEAKKAQEAFEEPFIRAGENIQNAFADAFTTILETGKINFQTLSDEGKRIMLRMVAEVAAAMIFKPVIQPILSQAMAGFSAAGGGSGVGGISSLGALGGLGSMGAISSAINSFGAARLGFSSGLEAARPTAGFVGPMPQATGSLFGTTTLMGALSGAGMGLGIGSMNLFGGNSTGSTIGGTLGGLGGSFFGPLGSLAGSAIGSGLGGLFGPGAKVSAAEFAGNIGANDNLAGLSYGAKNGQIAQARSLSDALGLALAGLVANGIDIANTNIRGAINSKSGNRFEALGKTFGFDPQDTESVSLAIAKMSIELAKAGNNSGSLAVALQNMQTEGRKSEEIISDLNFAASFDKLGEAPKKISETEQAIKDLHDRFAEMRTTTERLGLDVAKLNAAEASLFANIRDEFNKSVGSELLQATNSQGYAIAQEFARFNQQLEDAKKLGADINLVQHLHNQKMAEILGKQESSQEKQLASLQSVSDEAKRVSNLFVEIGKKARASITSLNLSSVSALSPEMKYAEARRIFEDTRRRAMLGDTEAGEDLPSVINDFLEQSREVNASNAQYKEDFAASQSALSSLADLADRQVISLAAQVDKQQKQVDLLQIIADNTGGKSAGANPYSDASLLPAGKPLSYLDSITSVGVSVRQYHTLARIAGYGGEFGQGGFDAFAKSNPQAAALFNQLLVASGGTMRAFAGGGRTPAGMPFLVGEKGPEILQFDTPGTVTPNHRLKSVGSDNTAVVQTLASGFSGLMEGQAIMSGQFQQLSNRLQRLESSMGIVAGKVATGR